MQKYEGSEIQGSEILNLIYIYIYIYIYVYIEKASCVHYVWHVTMPNSITLLAKKHFVE